MGLYTWMSEEEMQVFSAHREEGNASVRRMVEEISMDYAEPPMRAVDSDAHRSTQNDRQFHRGDLVTIAKAGTQCGQKAEIMDPDWFGMVKVVMKTGVDKGAVKSYVKRFLTVDVFEAAPLHKEEKVTILKEGRFEGCLAVVLDPTWNGR